MTAKVLKSNLTSSTLHLSIWDFGIGQGAGDLIDIQSYIFWDLRMELVIQLLFFYQISGGEKKHAWIKEDCTIVDPNCSNPSERRHFMRFTNAIGFKGKFYALSLQGTLAVIENIDSDLRITALGKKRAIPSVSSSHFREFMVESGEEVLLVFLICKTSSSIVDAVEVYRLETDKLRWIEMDSLGDRALFSGSNCCMSVSASKAGCKRNCVYFTHRSGDYCWWVYELDKATISPAQLG
ncbi:hypothetical protein OIU74_009020 [Salix koriyanagi]|uniref:KIB1-4 beta-propeller domain-containing protein n=1 Tax=Salix koriyanagi TaxID=2511006 RepID=A0A9Q0TRB6_9ROSI|nr:hypothetical protein OIU74_009020 [Salix koriyanagi]